MADKGIKVSVSGSTVSVDDPKAELSLGAGFDQAKWTCKESGLTNMEIRSKPGSSPLITTCSQTATDTWVCETKKFVSTDIGKYEYFVNVTVNGAVLNLDPDLIVKP